MCVARQSNDVGGLQWPAVAPLVAEMDVGGNDRQAWAHGHEVAGEDVPLPLPIVTSVDPSLFYASWG